MAPGVLDVIEVAVCPGCGCEAELYPCAGGAWLCVDCLGEQVTGDLDLVPVAGSRLVWVP